MFNSNLFFGPFKSKYENGIQFEENIYNDKDFVDFYNFLETEFNDYDIYENVLEHNENILEIGSGTGRMLKYLTNKGFDVYGLEPSEKMISYIDGKFKNKIFKFGIENISNIKNIKFKYVIIPATTISLFEFDVFEKFLIDLKSILEPKSSIYFDFWNEIYVENLDKKIEKIDYKNTKVFLGNHIKNTSLIFNIYLKFDGKEKLGISKKKIYKKSLIRDICKRTEYKVDFENIHNNTVLARLTNELL